jgi:RHS repeat-associated protein
VESGNAALSGFDTSQRGYTGHEHLAMFGMIHMNGRIYDPLLGRFMQADPIIDEPFNLQSYNRYAYVGNNPLAFTDPTGYSKWTRHRRTFWAVAATIATYGAASAYMTGAAIAGGGSTTFATVAVSSEAGGIIGASLTGTGQAVAAAAAGFASGGIQGGNLNSALSGAVTGAVTAGVNFAVSGSNLAVQVGAKAATSAAIVYVNGGDWRKAAYFAALSQLGRAGWEYAKSETDRLYLASCGRAGNCGADADGWKTDGGRNFESNIKPEEWERVPKLIRAYLGGGMAMEYEPHSYTQGESVCNMIGNLACSAVRGFVRQVSKPHDVGNSWSYDKNALSTTFGNRVEGGGFSSLASRVMYEVGMQTWSIGTMLPMAGYTAVSLYGDYFNPSAYSKGRK